MKLTLVWLSMACWAIAQTDQGRIVGTVVDSSGAVVPNASISVKNDVTGKTREVTADGNGFYAVTSLGPSTYSIIAKANSLGPAEYREIHVSVGQERTINIVLQPATVTTEVNVSGGE